MHRKAASVTAEKVAMASKLSVWFCGLKEIIQAKRPTYYSKLKRKKGIIFTSSKMTTI